VIVTAERSPRLEHDLLNNIGKVCSVPAVEVRNLEENFFMLFPQVQEFVLPSSHGHRHLRSVRGSIAASFYDSVQQSKNHTHRAEKSCESRDAACCDGERDLGNLGQHCGAKNLQMRKSSWKAGGAASMTTKGAWKVVLAMTASQRAAKFAEFVASHTPPPG